MVRYIKALLIRCYGLFIVLNFNQHVLYASFNDRDEQGKVAKSTYFLVVPGQNGMGGDNSYFEKIINPHTGRLKKVETPLSLPDFGQSRCQKYLAKAIVPLQQDDSVKNIVIHATSQGTATVLNYVAKNPHKVSAIILESVMASGNSAIHHTDKSLIDPTLANLPGSYYWLPYLAKFSQYIFYNPVGEQAIFACDDINMPRDIPIIITHAARDPQLSFNDAAAIYYKLTNNFNFNVYFMPVKEYKHFNLLNIKSYPMQIKAINTIMKNHGLPYADDMIDDNLHLDDFQPNGDDYKQSYIDLMKLEIRLRTIDYYFKRTAAFFIFAYICTYFV